MTRIALALAALTFIGTAAAETTTPQPVVEVQVEAGAVQVNGAPAASGVTIKPGDTLTVGAGQSTVIWINGCRQEITGSYTVPKVLPNCVTPDMQGVPGPGPLVWTGIIAGAGVIAAVASSGGDKPSSP
jgi:hypothetical protein